jgi:hypothetical protein
LLGLFDLLSSLVLSWVLLLFIASCCSCGWLWWFGFVKVYPTLSFVFNALFSDSSTSSSVSGDRSYFAARVLEVGMGWEVSWFVDGKGEQAA